MINQDYISCPCIENALTFECDSLYHCSLPLHGLYGWPYICEYKGGDLPIDKIEKSREHYRKLLKSNQCGNCEGCDYYLLKRNWSDHKKYFFNSLNIEHYTLCNLRCKYCCWLTTHKVNFGNIPYKFLPILKQLMENEWFDPDGFVFWGGGEPALLDEFPDCLEYMLDYGVKHEVSTNGTVFSKAIYDNLFNNNLTVTTSIDAATRDTFCAMKGKDLLFQVFENLEKYANTGGKVNIKYIMTQDNFHENEWSLFPNLLKQYNLNTCDLYIDMSHEKPIVEDYIIENMSNFCKLCEAEGIKTHVGLHGNHSLPRQNILQRVAFAKKY